MGANQMVAAQARNVPLERKGTFLYMYRPEKSLHF